MNIGAFRVSSRAAAAVAEFAEEMVAEAISDSEKHAAGLVEQIAKLTEQRAALLEALKSSIAIADEAAREWDKAAGPPAPRAGKILLALCGHVRGYRMDIDEIHAVIAKAEAEP